jgi:hypothetical protein
MYKLSATAVPDNLLACICERNRALHLQNRAEKKLCGLLLCSRVQVDERLLQHRSSGRTSPAVMAADAELHKAEQLLAKADELLDLAIDLRAKQQQLDDDFRHIDC